MALIRCSILWCSRGGGLRAARSRGAEVSWDLARSFSDLGVSGEPGDCAVSTEIGNAPTRIVRPWRTRVESVPVAPSRRRAIRRSRGHMGDLKADDRRRAVPSGSPCATAADEELARREGDVRKKPMRTRRGEAVAACWARAGAGSRGSTPSRRGRLTRRRRRRR